MLQAYRAHTGVCQDSAPLRLDKRSYIWASAHWSEELADTGSHNLR